MGSSLITHCGARIVTRQELDQVEAPAATDTWFPVKHAVVLDTVQERLAKAGFQVQASQLALTRSNQRFFGVLDLTTPLVAGVNLAVGVRSSYDKSLPLGFIAAERICVCDNLAFRHDLLGCAVTRKHTRFGSTRFGEAMCRAIHTLHQFQATEQARIRQCQQLELNDVAAEALMLRAYEKGLLSHRLLPQVIQNWREPAFAEFQARTAWSLENAFTRALAPVLTSNPQRFCSLTISLQGLFEGMFPQLALAS